MKLLVTALLFVLSTQGHAEEPKKVPVKEGYGTLDMKEYNKHNQSESESKANVTATTTCTDTAGVVHLQNEAGFDSCLINSRPGANDTIKTSKPGVGVKFGK